MLACGSYRAGTPLTLRIALVPEERRVIEGLLTRRVQGLKEGGRLIYEHTSKGQTYRSLVSITDYLYRSLGNFSTNHSTFISRVALFL